MTRPARVLVLTGAGVSAESGLATFRDAGGLWEGHRPEEVATPAAWRRDRALVWRFYQLRRAALRDARPNAAHAALVGLERALVAAGHAFTLVTQNVDGLHERAGSRPLCMHGSLLRLRCEACGAVEEGLQHVDPERLCACACGHPALRPDVVWFGEVPHHLEAIAEEVGRCTHFAALGTSGQVWPAAGLLAGARAAGARTWVGALEEPDNLHPADTFLRGPATRVVPRLVAEWLAELAPGAGAAEG